MAAPSLREQLRQATDALDQLRSEVDRLRSDNDELKADNEALRAENESLADQVAALKDAAGQDSTTSSKPPSSDPIKARKKRAERRADERETKRAQGKQPGAKGAHLARRSPDVVVEHQPCACRGCGADLAAAPVVGEVRRQVIDLPEVRPVVTDHVAWRRRCACGVETLAALPPDARAAVCWGPEVRAFAVYLLDRQHLPVERCAELLADLLGAQVSTGWLCQVQLEAAGRLAPFITELKDRLGAEPVVHADETGTAVRTTKHWMHTLTTNLLTLIAVHPKRGQEALRDIGVIGGYHGTVVHDGWAPYDIFDAATHAQCGVHLVRHLKDVGAMAAYAPWTAAMIGVLLEAKAASERAATQGLAAVEPELAAALRSRYHAALDTAFSLLPPGPKPRLRHSGGWSATQRKAWNLATRMRDGADQVLRLLDDTRVPLDNNAAERALRMTKLHDKISGCFHSLAGAEAFADIRSYLQTADHHGENLLGVLHQLFTTGPWIPPRPAGAT
ncbi:MAG: IS66 family transposase [Acidimicrobiales bacterium]